MDYLNSKINNNNKLINNNKFNENDFNIYPSSTILNKDKNKIYSDNNNYNNNFLNNANLANAYPSFNTPPRTTYNDKEKSSPLKINSINNANDVLIKSLLQIKDILSSPSLDFPSINTDNGIINKQNIIQGITQRINRIKGINTSLLPTNNIIEAFIQDILLTLLTRVFYNLLVGYG